MQRIVEFQVSEAKRVQAAGPTGHSADQADDDAERVFLDSRFPCIVRVLPPGGETSRGKCMRRLAWVVLLAALVVGCGDRGTSNSGTECKSMCDDSCQRLVDECGIDWGDCCVQACYSAFNSPGETVDQDGAICDSERDDVESMSCADVLTHVRERWSDADACGV